MKKKILGSMLLTALLCAPWASTASAVSLTVTNNLHQGTPLAPDSGFSLTVGNVNVGDPIIPRSGTLGTIFTSANASASATGAVSQTVASGRVSSPADFSGTFATADLSNPSISGVMGPKAAAGSISTWIENQNFNAAATATTVAGVGPYAVAKAHSDYSYRQYFTVNPGDIVNYHFDYSADFFLVDGNSGSSAGKSFFSFILASTDINGNTLNSTTPFTDTLTFSDYRFNDLSLMLDQGYGYWEAFTSATAIATPEPGTLLLLGAGMVGLVAYRRRRA